MDNNEENNEELVVNPVVDDNANSNIDEELEEIKFQKLNDEAMRANEKILTLEDIIASPEHQLTIIYGDDSILNISKVGDIMNDMRPITTDKKTLSSSNIVIPPVNPKLKNIIIHQMDLSLLMYTVELLFQRLQLKRVILLQMDQFKVKIIVML